MERATIVMHQSPGTRRLDAQPWYRQFWPWFLVVLPAASVVLSFLTLYMALETMDTVVPHDGVSASYSAPSTPATASATESTTGAATASGAESTTGAATASK